MRHHLTLRSILGLLLGIHGVTLSAQTLAEAQVKERRISEQIHQLTQAGNLPDEELRRRSREAKDLLRNETFAFQKKLEDGDLNVLRRELRAGLHLSDFNSNSAVAAWIRKVAAASKDKGLLRTVFRQIPPDRWKEGSIETVIQHGKADLLSYRPQEAAYQALHAGLPRITEQLLRDGSGISGEITKAPSDVIRQLVDIYPADGPPTGGLQKFLAEEAIQRGDLELLRRLLTWRPVSRHAMTELCTASLKKDCADCAELLVTWDSPPCDSLARLAVRALNLGAEEVLQRMLALGADPQEFAATIIEKNHRQLARFSLEAEWRAEAASRGSASFDMDARWRENDRTGLTDAVNRVGEGAFRQVMLQLVAGADPNSTSAEGERAITLAARRGRLDLVWALRAHGADDPGADPSGRNVADLLWDAYPFAGRRIQEGSKDPVVAVDLPSDLHLYQDKTAKERVRFRGDCCFGMDVEVAWDPTPRHLSALSVLAATRGEPELERGTDSPTLSFEWEGIRVSPQVERFPTTTLKGRCGCYLFTVKTKSDPAVVAESEELARRIYNSLTPTPCAPQGLRWAFPAVVLLTLLVLGKRRMSRRSRPGGGLNHKPRTPRSMVQQ